MLLLVVLMFLATSVTFDEVLARSPARGSPATSAGSLFAVAVSEGMLRGIRLGLPPLFRVPYYLILALFFLYPVALTPLLDRPEERGAALGAVRLLARRRARRPDPAAGRPSRARLRPRQRQPLALGVVSLDPVRRARLRRSRRGRPCSAGRCTTSSGAETEPYIFGPYFLVPFLLAVAVLLLEIGLVERSRGALRAALALPAGPGRPGAGRRIAPRPSTRASWRCSSPRLGGTPLYLTLLASAGFYAYAALRRVPMAIEALTAALAALAVVGPGTLDLGGLVAPRPLPILAVAALQLGLGLRRRDAWRCLVGACCLAVGAMIGPDGDRRAPTAGRSPSTWSWSPSWSSGRRSTTPRPVAPGRRRGDGRCWPAWS